MSTSIFSESELSAPPTIELVLRALNVLKLDAHVQRRVRSRLIPNIDPVLWEAIRMHSAELTKLYDPPEDTTDIEIEKDRVALSNLICSLGGLDEDPKDPTTPTATTPPTSSRKADVLKHVPRFDPTSPPAGNCFRNSLFEP